MEDKQLKLLLFALTLLSLAYCKSPSRSIVDIREKKEQGCCSDTISSFDKKSVLNSFVSTMKSLIPDYKGSDNRGFSVSRDCRLVDIFIYDLTDTTNFEVGYEGCIDFKEGHIYHFASIINQLSYSNIAILYHGQVKLFTAINCPGKGDRLQDVMDFINSSMPQVKDNTDLVSRVSNYRKFGFYRSEDPADIFVCK